MWYYEQNGNRIGPVDEPTMRGLIANRTISIDTLVWTNGMATGRRSSKPNSPPACPSLRQCMATILQPTRTPKRRIAWLTFYWPCFLEAWEFITFTQATIRPA